MAGVAVNILTGFLGSGKTTLLKHVLEHGLEEKRIAIIMNEIGDIGIDGKVITGFQNVEEMIEVSSGCICCSVSGQFGLAVREILDTVSPHLIILESTGVAEPYSLVQQVREAGLALDAVITVVDALNLETALAETEAAKEQILGADFLVLNKIDLVSEDQRQQVEKRLRQLNQRAMLRVTEHGKVQTDLLFGTSVGRYRNAAADEHQGHHDHLQIDAINSFIYKGSNGERLIRKRFERFLEKLPKELYRAKGMVHFEDSDSVFLFNFTCGRFDIEAFIPPQHWEYANQAVFIGKNARSQRDTLRKELQRCAANTRKWSPFRRP